MPTVKTHTVTQGGVVLRHANRTIWVIDRVSKYVW